MEKNTNTSNLKLEDPQKNSPRLLGHSPLSTWIIYVMLDMLGSQSAAYRLCINKLHRDPTVKWAMARQPGFEPAAY